MDKENYPVFTQGAFWLDIIGTIVLNIDIKKLLKRKQNELLI
jgi:hypothetical protein